MAYNIEEVDLVFEEMDEQFSRTMENYKIRHTAVERAYRKAFKTMTTEKFWKEYLGI